MKGITIAELVRDTSDLIDEEGFETEAGSPISNATPVAYEYMPDLEVEILTLIPADYSPVFVHWPSNIFVGKVMAVTKDFIAQDFGNKIAKIHVVNDLTVIPSVGDIAKITCVENVSQVELMNSVKESHSK